MKLIGIAWNYGSGLGKVFRLLGFLGQSFGDFRIGLGVFGSYLGLDLGIST
jgi:hypothetical protein